jgi:hypothetical protein
MKLLQLLIKFIYKTVIYSQVRVLKVVLELDKA